MQSGRGFTRGGLCERPRATRRARAAPEIQNRPDRQRMQRLNDSLHCQQVERRVIEREGRALTGTVERAATAEPRAALDVARRALESPCATSEKRKSARCRASTRRSAVISPCHGAMLASTGETGAGPPGDNHEAQRQTSSSLAFRRTRPDFGCVGARALSGDVETDVAIIGAGMTGLTAAVHLASLRPARCNRRARPRRRRRELDIRLRI